MTYYSDHFGFSGVPFSKEIDDAQLWLPPSKKGVVSDLVECVQERKHAVVTGEPGVGKTCVLRAARNALGTQAVRLTYCHNVTLGRRDFYRHLCHALAIPYGSTAGDVFLAVTRHVEDLARDRTFPVLLIDEAHLLHQDTLDHLHILLNYAWDSRALLSLVLVGLPELRQRLALRHNRSLHSRLHHRLEVSPLTPDDTFEYLRLRLARVGCTREVFASDATVLLHEATLDAMRDLDRLAATTLCETTRKKRKLVKRDMVARVIETDARKHDR